MPQARSSPLPTLLLPTSPRYFSFMSLTTVDVPFGEAVNIPASNADCLRLNLSSKIISSANSDKSFTSLCCALIFKMEIIVETCYIGLCED